jgi:hypothetical protein
MSEPAQREVFVIGKVYLKNVEEKHECQFVFSGPFELVCNGCLRRKSSKKMYPAECDECPKGECSDCPRVHNGRCLPRGLALNLELCCNDPDSGSFTGRFDFANVHDVNLVGGSITCGSAKPPKWTVPNVEGGDGLRVGRIVVPVLDYTYGYGNWCWDRWKVRAVHALRVLNYLAAKKDWHCEEAAEEIYTAFNERRKITPEEWKRYLANEEK